MGYIKLNINILRFLYLFILIFTIVLVTPPHVFPPPNFMFLRFPTHLESMGSFLSVSWPITFEIYHLGLVVLTLIISINALGLTFLRIRPIAKISSFLGLFLITAIFLFFLFPFMKVNASTAIIYSIYFLFLLIVDLSTFLALIKK
ncbi:MAG: hypothetical protein HYT07_02680 [Candidatus Levybacteria bacterium]|nr:hypothetical protein [Candidatus Levybacteria bacterium]